MDTPEMSLERFHLIVGDLRLAQKFANYILSRKFHGKKGDRTQLVHRAFNLSMIVSYCRPFARNREGSGREAVADSPIWNLAWPLLGKQRVALHREIIDQRNNIFAHSPTGKRFDIPPAKGSIAIEYDVFAPLTLEKTRVLSSILKTWLEYLEPLKSKFS